MSEKALTHSDLYACDTPPLADIGGIASLEDRKLPDYLRGVPDRILEAFERGSKVVVLFDAKARQPGGLPPAKKSDNDQSLHLEESAGMHQFMLRGLAQDPRFKDAFIWDLDDRGHDKGEQKRAAEFARHAIEAEETGEDVAELLERLQGKDEYAKNPKTRLVVAITPELVRILNDVNRDKKDFGNYVGSKLTRIHDAETASIELNPQGNMYADWDRYFREADTAEVQRLLKEAARLAQPEEGVVKRAFRGFPKEWLGQEAQREALIAACRVLQLQLFSGNHLLLTGGPGIGKTTLLAAAYQLFRQTGNFNPRYLWWRDNAAPREEQGYVTEAERKRLQKESPANNLGRGLESLVIKRFDHDGERPEDQEDVLCIDQAEFGVRNTDYSLAGHVGIDPGEGYSTQNSLRPVGHRRLRLIMTSNQDFPGDARWHSTLHHLADFRRLTDAAASLQDEKAARTYLTFIRRIFQVALGGQDWSVEKDARQAA